MPAALLLAGGGGCAFAAFCGFVVERDSPLQAGSDGCRNPLLDRPQARPQKWIKWEKSELDPTFPGEGDIANAITERDLLILIGLARRDLPPTMINAAPNARGALGLPSRAPGRRLDAAVRSRRLGRSSAASTKPRQVSRRAGEGDGQPKAAEPFNIPAELGILALRLGTSTMMFHNGLDKVRVVPPPCLLLARWCGCGPTGEKEILTTLVPLSPPPSPLPLLASSRIPRDSQPLLWESRCPCAHL